MTINDYQRAALSTARTMRSKDMTTKLINGALGLTGESGEVADLLKKHCFQGHSLDKQHIAEELARRRNFYKGYTEEFNSFDERIKEINKIVSLVNEEIRLSDVQKYFLGKEGVRL